MLRVTRNLAVALFVISLVPAVIAQTTRGALAGTVSDPSGAVVPNAKVLAKHEQTGVVTEGQTSGDGNFRIPNLPVGTYTVTISAPGFKAAENTGVPIDINSTAALNVTLLPGAISETVSVAADAPTVQSESSEIGTTVNARQVLQLPLAVNGVGGLRSPEAFVFLTPGTVGPGSATDNGQNGDNPSSNNGGAFQSKISGSQNFANEVLVDGASMFRSENGSSFDETAQSVESIEEFRVQTSTYPAEYGRTGGGVTSFVTKSGTNKYHGDVYDFFRNRELDANRFFNNAFGTLRPLDNHNDFGATLGGPVWAPKIYNGKDRTFFFFSYEGFRRTAGGPIINTLPTAQYLQGNFSSLLTNQQIGTDALGRPIYRGQIFDPTTTRTVNGQIVRDPFFNNVIEPAKFSAVAKNVLKLFPQPTGGGVFQNYIFSGKTPVTANTYTTKIDHNFSEKNRISGVWTWRRNDRSAGDPNLPEPLNSSSFHQVFTTNYFRAAHDYTFAPNLLNHLNLGYNRTYSDNRPYSADQGWASTLGLQGVRGTHFPIFTFGDNITDIGRSNYNLNIDNGIRANDAFSWIKGSHSLRFGGDWRYQIYTPRNFGNSGGAFHFGHGQTAASPTTSADSGFGFASFLVGAVGGADIGVPIDNQWRSKYMAYFVQDDWKATRNLTLNLGLRWDVDFPRHELHDRMSSLVLNMPNPGAGNRPGALGYAGEGSTPRVGTRTFADTWWKDWGPRIGFAYSPQNTDGFGRLLGGKKTVIRGGYGIYYQALIYADFGERLSAGFGGGSSFNSQNGFDPRFNLDQGMPQDFARPPFISPTLLNGNDIEWVNPEHGRPPMIQNWSLQVQREVATDLLLTAGYVGVAGHHLRSSLLNLNALPPQYMQRGDLLFADINSPEAKAAGFGLPYPGFTGSVFQSLRPYPQYNFINSDCCLENIGNSTYHAFQATVERRFRAGLTLLASYTFSKTLTDADSALPVFATFSGGGSTQNPYDRRAEKSLSNQDIPHIAVISYLYELPFGEGKTLRTDNKVVDKVIGGWQLNGVHRYQSGQPLSFNGFGGPPTWGSIRPNLVPGQNVLSDKVLNGTFNPLTDSYFNRAAFQDPNAGRKPTDPFQVGAMPRTVGFVRSAPYYNEDLSLFKNNFFGGERRNNVQFRAESFNTFNRTVLRRPNTCVPCGEFGRIFGQANNPRTLQLVLKVIF